MTTHSGARREPSQRSETLVPEIDVARFEFVGEIGAGGMGTVYKALQRSVGRHVAVKVLDAEQAANALGLVRFVREANAIARIAHPNIVQLVDFGRDHLGRMLLVMELLEGASLRDALRRTPTLAPERAVFVAVQVLGALRAAHANGIVHRDLKPENVFLQRVGSDDHVKVLDFGVAKIAQSDDPIAEHHTTQGTMVGTLRYMAPEQIAGEAPDHRVDLFAVGVLLYEMLAGAAPFDTRDRFVLLRQILTEEPTLVSVRSPHVTPQLAAVVMHALRKSPAERFQSADEFRHALLPFLAREHAGLAELSESRSATPAHPAAVEDQRSGVVRTGGGLSNATVAQRPAAIAAAAAESRPSGRRALIAAAVVGALALAGGGSMALRSRRAPPAVASAVPLTPPAPDPSAAPSAPVPTRMVLVDTAPRGAQVQSAEGEVLCASTPCAVPVRMGSTRAVRVVLDAVRVEALLDAAQAHAMVDLAALQAPPTVPPPPRRERAPVRRERPPEGEGIPMLLPGGR